MRVLALILLALVVGACSREEAAPADVSLPEPAAAAAEPGLDPVSGLKMTGDWLIVRSACTACHSAKLVTQQSGTARQWLAMIRWMQAKQNLWEFDKATEDKIIAYLAENYPPRAAQRRAALATVLMPPNPYDTVVDGS